jgi:HemY protein
LSAAADGGILDKRTARRQRAVMLAAQAIDLEQGEPDRARQAALQAHELAPDLVPAATVAGRLLARQGDVRRATRLLEETWKVSQHPEVAEAYLHVRSGDSASDRLKRAEALFRLRPHSDDGRLAVARAAIEARDFERAREMLAPILTERPTQRALTIMAELEEADSGDRGRAASGWRAPVGRRAIRCGPPMASSRRLGAGLAGDRPAGHGRMEGAGRRAGTAVAAHRCRGFAAGGTARAHCRA